MSSSTTRYCSKFKEILLCVENYEGYGNKAQVLICLSLKCIYHFNQTPVHSITSKVYYMRAIQKVSHLWPEKVEYYSSGGLTLKKMSLGLNIILTNPAYAKKILGRHLWGMEYS